MFRILHYKNLLLIYIYPFWSFHFIINPASRNITPAPANIQPIQKYDFNPISTVRPSILSDKKPIVRLPITPISPAKIPPQIKLSTPVKIILCVLDTQAIPSGLHRAELLLPIRPGRSLIPASYIIWQLSLYRTGIFHITIQIRCITIQYILNVIHLIFNCCFISFSISSVNSGFESLISFMLSSSN